jgi:uncharacterized membrane protein YhaH (DUF805 family)
MDWYLAVLKKYAIFNGRARRREFWYFFLLNILLLMYSRELTLQSAPLAPKPVPAC